MLRPASARLRGLRRALWPGRGTPRRGCRAAAAAAEPQPPSAPPAEPLWWTLAGRILHRPAFQKRSEFGFAQALRSAPAEELFRGQSEAGNGLVTLTRHGAFTSLRFGTSDQGLSYTGTPSDPDWRGGSAVPSALCYEYTRTMAAAAVAFARLNGEPLARVLCVGLGSGTLPAFLAHAHPSAAVQVVEIDPLVESVVRDVLGVAFETVPLRALVACAQRPQPGGGGTGGTDGAAAAAAAAFPPPPPFQLALGDAADAVALLRSSVARRASPPVSALFLDAFQDGGLIPAHLRAPSFLADACGCLAPGGVLVANLFNAGANSVPRQEMAAYAAALAAALAGGGGEGEGGGGAVWSVKVWRQQSNVVLVAARPGSRAARARPPRRAVVDAARDAARGSPAWPFDPGDLVEQCYEVDVGRGGGGGPRGGGGGGGAGVVTERPAGGGGLAFWDRNSASDYSYADDELRERN